MQKTKCKNKVLNLLILVYIFFPISINAGSYGLDYEGMIFDEYIGELYSIVNDNVPYFDDEEYYLEPFESYSDLDELGRAGGAYSLISQELMPTEDRESISSVIPSGWVQEYYDFVSGKYLYNRSHLIGFQLTGENANKLNLITGTRTFNVSGMLPFENDVATYVKTSEEYSVLYRVTPVYENDNLLATGVIMEASSVEDRCGIICFNVFVYNAEPGVYINYADGTSYAIEDEDDELDEYEEEKLEEETEKYDDNIENDLDDTIIDSAVSDDELIENELKENPETGSYISLMSLGIIIILLIVMHVYIKRYNNKYIIKF